MSDGLGSAAAPQLQPSRTAEGEQRRLELGHGASEVASTSASTAPPSEATPSESMPSSAIDGDTALDDGDLGTGAESAGLTREQLLQEVSAGHRRAGSEGALASQLARELLHWAKTRLSEGDPYVVTMAGRNPQKLHHLKLMYGSADAEGMLPIYNFGFTKASWKRVWSLCQSCCVSVPSR